MNGLEDRIPRLLGAHATSWQRRSAPWQPADAVAGGNDRFTVHLDDGRRVFAKAAKAPHTARWLRREAEVYAHLHGTFIADLIAFEDDPIEPLLVLDDLSDTDWGVRGPRPRPVAGDDYVDERSRRLAGVPRRRRLLHH